LQVPQEEGITFRDLKLNEQRESLVRRDWRNGIPKR